MKYILGPLVLCAVSAAQAQPTIFTGGPGDSPFTATAFDAVPNIPSDVVAAGGNPGGYLRLTQAQNDILNNVAFDRTNVGAVPISSFSFDFRITASILGRFGNSADGFNITYVPTANYGIAGTTGAALSDEDPDSFGALGFSFDTWSNNGGLGGPDDPNQPQNSNYEEISLFYNGALIQRIDDTEQLFPAITLDDGLFHFVNGVVNFAAGTVSLTVDQTLVFLNTPVPGLTPFESRVSFGGRTGGENEEVAIDNLNVQYVPEPTVFGMLALSSLVLLRRRHR